MKPFIAALFALLVACAQPLAAQAQQPDVAAQIRHQDSLFWKAYNACDVPAMARFFTEDMEFYHDKGGEQKGLAFFAENTKKNLCGNDNFRLRREEMKGSMAVFPLEKNGAVYGAILSGAHFFYINEKGKAEYRDGLARFTHLWLLKDGQWKMSRVLSYDHGPADRPFDLTKQ